MVFQYIQDFFSLGKERLRQLKEQDEIDTELQKLKYICPNVLNDYFIVARKHNYYLSKNIYESSITNIIEKSKEQIIIVDEQNKELNNIVKLEDSLCQCSELVKFNKKIFNSIK